MPRCYRLKTISAILGCALLGGAAARAEILIPDEPDPLLDNLKIPNNAAKLGMWSKTFDWPIIGIHSALLPSGDVLTFGAAPGKGVQDGRTFDIWEPGKGLGLDAHTLLPNAQAVDSFCAAATNMISGSMLISGGNTPASGYSAKASTAFDPSDWRPSAIASQLAYERWYGTMITLTDGRPLIVGGGKPYVVNAYSDVGGSLARGDVSMIPEVYEAATGWRLLPGAESRDAFGPDFNRWWYPRMWVAPTGKVFGVSTEKMWLLDPAGNGAITTLGTFKTPYNATTRPNVGPTSTAVMYDTGRILQAGGNGYNNGFGSPSSAAATIFDVRRDTPAVVEAAPMAFPRQWANSTVLPNGHVLVTGGTRFADNAGADAVYDAEIWNPASGVWRTAAKAANYRGYHSSTILLRNGAVLSLGGGAPGPATNLNGEIYYPPYLFQKAGSSSVLAERPKFSAIDADRFLHGTTATLTLAADSAIGSVALIGLSSTTHSFNTGQRRMRLAFTQAGRSLTVTMPAAARFAPPGYYQIVAINPAGAPSKGVIVSLRAAEPEEADPAADAGAKSLQPVRTPNLRVRHFNNNAFVEPIRPSSPFGTKLDSSFFVRPGLADAACVSFESVNFPGSFLRHSGFRLRIDGNNGSELFRNDATFCRQPGLIGDGDSFQSKNYPGRFIHHRNGEVWIDPLATDSGFRATASFDLVNAMQ